MTWCKILTNGLQYMNFNKDVAVGPCCYWPIKEYPLEKLTDALNGRSKWSEVTNEVISKNCKTCISQESAGVYSLRNFANNMLDGTTDKIEFLTVVPGLTCNSACAICSPKFSSFWYQESVRHNLELSDQLIQLHDVTDPNYTDFHNALYSQDLSELKYVRFGGGEPMMMPQHTQILDAIPNKENVTLYYTSNFTIMPTADILARWKQFKLVKWVASIDGVGERYEYLRWPTTWEKLTKQVAQAKEIMPSNVMFGVEHTLNCFNAYYFDEFEEWFKQNLNTNREGDPSDFSMHIAANEYKLSLIPPALRTAIYDKFGPAHKISMLVSQCPNDTDYAESIDKWNMITATQGLDWKTVFPDIVPYYEDVL